MFTAIGSSLIVVIMGISVLLNLASLPGNWVMAFILLGWLAFIGNLPEESLFYFILFGLAVLGEIIEFGTQFWGAKKYGSSTASTWAGILGAVVGAVILAPFFFGLGAIFGALLGAWLASFAAERIRGQDMESAAKAAKGALIGRFLGMVVKFGIGIAMLSYASNKLTWS